MYKRHPALEDVIRRVHAGPPLNEGKERERQRENPVFLFAFKPLLCLLSPSRLAGAIGLWLATKVFVNATGQQPSAETCRESCDDCIALLHFCST